MTTKMEEQGARSKERRSKKCENQKPCNEVASKISPWSDETGQNTLEARTRHKVQREAGGNMIPPVFKGDRGVAHMGITPMTGEQGIEKKLSLILVSATPLDPRTVMSRTRQSTGVLCKCSHSLA